MKLLRSMNAQVTGAVALAVILIGSQSFTSGSLAGGAASSLSLGKASLARGQTQQAIKQLQEAVKAQPTSCEAHLCLGQAYVKGKNYVKAKDQLRSAIHYGRGSANAQKANAVLMTLPKAVLSPKSGAGTAMIARTLGIMSLERGAEAAKPTVIDFYASWAQPCKLLKPSVDKAKAEYGEKVNFMMVNVDDPSSDDIVDKYGVSPVPTLVFLKPDGEVATFSVGYSGDQSVVRGIQKILPSG